MTKKVLNGKSSMFQQVVQAMKNSCVVCNGAEFVVGEELGSVCYRLRFTYVPKCYDMELSLNGSKLSMFQRVQKAVSHVTPRKSFVKVTRKQMGAEKVETEQSFTGWPQFRLRLLCLLYCVGYGK